GSAGTILAGIARDHGADRVWCVRQLAVDGVLTGEIDAPMIGPAKAAAVRRTLADLDLDAAHCHAYGDDLSDLPMLQTVGHPVAIGRDSRLAAHARAAGWPVLPYT